MIFITGPRQVGKTHLAQALGGAYFNWDTVEVRKAYAQDPYFFRSGAKLVVLDEIHKRRDWKKLLKGYYDSPSRKENFLVTGSGRLDVAQRGGDSLAGRYDAFQLWPLTWDEIRGAKPNPALPRAWASWEPDERTESDADLLRLGGFPAPFTDGRESALRRWQDQYLDRIVREDARDFSAIQKIDQLDLLARILPERTTSPLSVLSLSRDVEASTVAVKSWIQLFETLHLGFQLKPFHRKIHRAVKREAKWYFQQWTYNQESGARFENYLAVQLSAACSAWTEQGHGRWELFYLRDQDHREVDFVVCRDLKPQALIEAKSSAQPWPSSLAYYARQLKIPGFLVYPEGALRRQDDGLGWSLPSRALLKGLVLK